MRKIGLFCSDSNCSMECASCIQKHMGEHNVEIDVRLYKQNCMDDALQYDTLIFGLDSMDDTITSTRSFFSYIDLYKLSGKSVSFIGSTSKEKMKDSIVHGTYLRDKLYERGAKTITNWALKHEDFHAPFGFKNSIFQGLMLEKESIENDALIGKWCNNMLMHMSA